MSEQTNIEWASSTGSPWIGCAKVSPGCKNCYAATMDEQRFSKTMGGGTKEKPLSHWGKGAPRVRTKAFWKDAVKWNREAAILCQQCNTQVDATGCCRNCPGIVTDFPDRPRIFPSLCDWLDDEVPIEWLADFLKLIHDTPNLDWLLLTKRPENWRHRIQEALTLWEDAPECVEEMVEFLESWTDCLDMPERGAWPENVWVGVSVEDQKRADGRIPLLLQIPAKVRFLSVEPLLSPVKFDDEWFSRKAGTNSGIHWVIVGGESGKDRRDCGPDAIEHIAAQCEDYDTPVFVKQDCAFKPGQQGRIPQEIWALKEFPR